MKLDTYRYQHERGWQPALPEPNPGMGLVVVFGASRYIDDHRPFDQLSKAFPDAAITGCSTAGEIHGQELYDDTLVAAALGFDDTRVEIASVAIDASGSARAGAELGVLADAAADLRAVFLLSDGTDVNGSELSAAINRWAPAPVSVSGGLAADGDRFEETWVLVDGKPTPGHATAVGLYGEHVRLGHGSKGGWDIFGPERVVSRARGHILYELDGQPALGLYKKYLGDLADDLPASGLLFPLSLRAPGDHEKRLVRTILGVDEDAGALVFAGDVPEGHRAQLMQANFDRLVDGAEEAADGAALAVPGPALSIAISCVGRRLVLGERAEDELEATQHIFGDSVSQIGFYSYGEISPYAAGNCELHNQTMTLTVVGEV